MKTLVNIFSEVNPASTYLFIKEMYEAGDELLFIATKDTEEAMEALIRVLALPAEVIHRIVLNKERDAFIYERICRQLREKLRPDANYHLNLAGGTRYLALAVRQAFEKYKTKFFYTNVEHNVIISTIYDDSIDDNDDYVFPIRYRMSVGEYFAIHRLSHDITSQNRHHAHFPCDLANRIFDSSALRRFTEDEYEVFDRLREGYRNAKSRQTHRTLHALRQRQRIAIDEICAPKNPEWWPIPNLKNFLHRIGFVPKTPGFISREELEYLTGGWFEEFIFYWVQTTVNPDDIATGVHISRNVARHDNELDVVFMRGNKLFVMECKSGISTTSLFNEIVYKACALKRALLGLSCKFYLCSLKKDENNELKKIAESMDVTFCDHAILSNPHKRSRITTAIRRMTQSKL